MFWFLWRVLGKFSEIDSRFVLNTNIYVSLVSTWIVDHVTCVTLRRRVLMFWKTPTYMKINAILLQTAWRRWILWYLFSLLRDFLWCKILFLLFLWKSFGCPWKDAVICKLKSFLCTSLIRLCDIERLKEEAISWHPNGQKCCILRGEHCWENKEAPSSYFFKIFAMLFGKFAKSLRLWFLPFCSVTLY